MSISNHPHIGIVGEGQLAKMLAFEGIRLGMKFSFWVQNEESIINELGHIYKPNTHTFDIFCNAVDSIIIDYEHVPLEQIAIMEHHFPYQGHAQLLRKAQDRLLEKKLLNQLSIPHADYLEINSFDDIFQAASKLDYPIVLKKRRHAYDGKGQYILKDIKEINAFKSEINPGEYIAEQFIPFDKEFSLISVRGAKGEFSSYDVTENIHHKGILIESRNIPNHPAHHILASYNKLIAEACDYIGVFAVEYFQHHEKFLVKEISPRVHNTGHWTLDVAYCSQFENHLRACTHLPLGNTDSYAQATMLNVIGDWESAYQYINHPKAKIYDYGKKPRLKRKLGHITLID